MKSRNIKNAFLSRVPFAASVVVGKVYDDINKNQVKKSNFGRTLDTLVCLFCLNIVVPSVPIPLKIFWPYRYIFL